MCTKKIWTLSFFLWDRDRLMTTEALVSFDYAQDKPCRLFREPALSLPKGRLALGAAGETAALQSAGTEENHRKCRIIRSRPYNFG